MTDEQIKILRLPTSRIEVASIDGFETHLTPEINTELAQMRDDWEKERQENLP